MKKLLVLALVCAMSFAAVGCGSDKKDAGTPKTEETKEEKADEPEAEETKAEEPAEEEAKTVDAGALAAALNSDISYSDTLTEVDLDTASMFLNFADVQIEEGYIYESSGATAEEIVVLVLKDEDSTAKAKVAFEQRVEEQTDNFTDYVPEEVPKLKDAVIVTDGVYAVLSVSGDSSKAKEIIAGALK